MLGAVADRPLLVEDAANALIGTEIDDDALEARGSGAACNPIDDKRGTIEYRRSCGCAGPRATAKALERGIPDGKAICEYHNQWRQPRIIV